MLLRLLLALAGLGPGLGPGLQGFQSAGALSAPSRDRDVTNVTNASLASLPLAQVQIATLVENRLRLLYSRLSLLEEEESEGALSVARGTVRGAKEPRREARAEAALRDIWRILEDLLKAVINALRLLLDPAPLGSYDLSFNNSFIKGRLAAHGVLARHLRETQFHATALNPFTMCTEARVLVPRLSVKTHYDADLSVDDGSGELMPIFGAGRAQIDLQNAKLSTKVCLSIREFSIKVADMKVSLQKAEVDLRGLFGGGAISDLISGIAADVLPDVVEEYEPEITQLAMEYINEFIRKILHREYPTIAAVG